MAYLDPLGGHAVAALFLGGGIVAGALVGWVIGPVRGPSLLARSVSHAAIAALAALLAASLVPSGFLALAGRVSLTAVLGFLCGGLTQTLAMAWSGGGVREGSGQGCVLVLASLLCPSL